MSIASHPILSLAQIIEALKASSAVVASFIVENDDTTAVRLVLRGSGLELAFDIETSFAPDCGTCHLDPCLTDASRQDLMDLGVLPADPMDALAQGSGLALEIAGAHQRLIAQTMRSFLAA